jgi:hypothetical protein
VLPWPDLNLEDPTMLQMPSVAEMIVERAKIAQEHYAKAIAGAKLNRAQAITGIVAYGRALLEAEEQKLNNNRKFNQWVSDNCLDEGEPWSVAAERRAAMNLAKALRHDRSFIDKFTDCPHDMPTHVFGWFRKAHGGVKARKPDEANAKAIEAIKTLEAMGETVTESRIAELSGVAGGTANKAFNILRRERAAARKAATETLEKLTDEQLLERADFTPKARLSIDKAIEIHRRRLDKAFEATVDAEVRRRIVAADEAMRAHNKTLSLENTQLRQQLNSRALFTQAEFKLILMALHPDNSASSENRARAFDLVRQKEKQLVKQ